ncbi:MAG: hypothetical protein ACD_10C00377G0002 [uncultured bacterium]|nr:MAG: hypothetical protein ACD_10C00377G0002 [uncultured bacterium]
MKLPAYRFCPGGSLFLLTRNGEESDPLLPDPETGAARCRLVADGFDRPLTSIVDLIDCAEAHLRAQGLDPRRYNVYPAARYYWLQEQVTRAELEAIRSMFSRGKAKAA